MKHKILSFLTAFAMVFGIIAAPFVNANAAEATETESVTIHKILLTKAALDKHDVNKDYDGKELENITEFFGDNNAKEIDGVYFKLQKPAKGVTNPDVNKDTDWVDVEGKAGLTGSLDENGNVVKETDTTTKKVPGLKIDTKGLKGTYRIVEDLTKSKYKGEKGEVLAKAKAVPTLLELPIVNGKEGIVKDAHVYPKNTQEKPEIDKNFAKTNTAKEVKKGNFDLSTDKSEGKQPVTAPNAGANYDNYQKEKARVTAELGKPVPFEVKTKIPQDSKYRRLVWTDTMTNGLTFNKDLKITGLVGKADDKKETQEANLEEGTDYVITSDDRGFELRLTQDGLKKLERVTATRDVEVVLKYSAKMNKDAVRDMPEKNDIGLDYGNKPSTKQEPKEGKPSNKEIKVEKSWDINGDNTVTEADANAKVVYTLQEKDGESWKEVKSVLVTSKESFKYTFTGLDNNKTYRVIERVTGYEPQYTSFENGVVKITNKGDKDNPKPLDPSEPEVVNGGKKFVKTDNGTDKATVLKDAIFAVKKGKQYLAYKSDATNQEDAAAKKKAKDAYIKAINEFNAMSKTDQEGEKGKAKEKEIGEKKDAYFKAFKADQNKYAWVDDINDAIHLQSNDKGQFEVEGLEYGKYELVEVKAPAGYAKLQGPIDFDVVQGKDEAEDINYESAAIDKEAEKDAKRVPNKKVSIPQTGGIGSIIFVVAGLMIMGLAAYKMKANKEQA